MKSLQNTDLLSILSNQVIFLDTNVLIGAIEYPELIGKFLNSLKDVDTTLMTIPSVVFEFSRGENKSIGMANSRNNFLKSLASVLKIENYINEEMQTFTHLVHNNCSKASYTDFMLVFCLYKFQNTYLITENHYDMPLSILDRVELVTFDTEKSIRTYGFYKFSKEKFDKAISALLERRSN